MDRDDKKNRKESVERLVQLLKQGKSVCMYPEATWNLEPSKPMLPLYWGIIDIAQNAEVPIVPLVLEFKGNDCYAKFGELLYVEATADKTTKIDKLTDIMATLKWDIWEQFPVEHRTDEVGTEWEREKAQRMADYPNGDWDNERKYIRRSEK